MSARATSRVFELLRSMKARLAEASWPANPVSGRIPRVGFASVSAQTGEELVVLRTVDPQAASEWTTVPAGRNETLYAEIVIDAQVVRKTEDEVLDRLEVLADIVQHQLRDETTGQPYPLLGDHDLSYGQIVDVLPDIYPVTGGFVGRTEMRVQWLARI